MASLLPPTKDQAYCDISALEAGLITLPFEMFITNAPPGMAVLPSLSFLLKHSLSQKLFIFDLGIRRDWENYPPAVVEWIQRIANKVQIPQDVVESLAKGGTSPDDISTVCYSTVITTTLETPSSSPRADLWLGSSLNHCFSPPTPKISNLHFHPICSPGPECTQYLDPSGWQPLGPFPRAFDFHGDGSLHIIDSPGHLAGHINILARTSADGGWIYLAGDSARHWNLITGKSDIAVGYRGHANSCAHANKEQAEAHILRIHELMKIPRVHDILTHDEPWYLANKGGSAFWPGQIPSL
ncbi:Metallo-hydrolase/oxidoreductase [Infundibulicybe gibba]|nr:Metallo-hydrolase/oxidoreductase [Infundibulicybe gibba]